MNILIDSQVHLVFEILAYFAGYRYYTYLRKREIDKISSNDRIWIFIAGCAGAIILSKFIAVMDHYDQITKETPFYFYFTQKTIVGGLLGGLIAIEIVKKILNIKHSSGDLMTYPLILGIAIGRVGCFFAGLSDGTHGVQTDLLLGYDFGDGIKRHPTQIYEILFLGFLYLFLKILENNVYYRKENKLMDGLKFKLFLSSYLLFRFCIEFIKPVSPFAFGLSFIQLSCLAGISYYLILTLRFLSRNKNYA